MFAKTGTAKFDGGIQDCEAIHIHNPKGVRRFREACDYDQAIQEAREEALRGPRVSLDSLYFGE